MIPQFLAANCSIDCLFIVFAWLKVEILSDEA